MSKLKLLSVALALSAIVTAPLLDGISYAKHGDDNGNVNGHGHQHHDKHHGHGQDYDYDHNYYKAEKHHHHHHNEAMETDYSGAHHHYHGPYFNEQRVTMIRDYYTPEELDRLPPGLRKHIERTGQLPPGLQKKLVVNEPLPPGYLPYMVPAPPQLVGTMGPLPPDSQLYLYNGDAVLVNPKTQAVLDVVNGVLTLTGH